MTLKTGTRKEGTQNICDAVWSRRKGGDWQIEEGDAAVSWAANWGGRWRGFTAVRATTGAA